MYHKNQFNGKIFSTKGDIMKLNSITQKQLIDIKNQLNKKYDKIPLNNRKELINCYSDIITVDNILNSYYIPPTFNEELTFFDY